MVALKKSREAAPRFSWKPSAWLISSQRKTRKHCQPQSIRICFTASIVPGWCHHRGQRQKQKAVLHKGHFTRRTCALAALKKSLSKAKETCRDRGSEALYKLHEIHKRKKSVDTKASISLPLLLLLASTSSDSALN